MKRNYQLLPWQVIAAKALLRVRNLLLQQAQAEFSQALRELIVCDPAAPAYPESVKIILDGERPLRLEWEEADGVSTPPTPAGSIEAR